VIDVGGASSRPRGIAYGSGASTVPADVELARVLPIVELLAAKTTVPISIDTTQAHVATGALRAGARIVNDVSCACHDELLAVVAESDAEYVLMHNRGDGSVQGEHIRYHDVVTDVCDELQQGVERALRAGIAAERIWLDPGLGFAKTTEQSLRLLAATDRLRALGHRLLVGPSRKAFLGAAGALVGATALPPTERQPATDAAVALAAWLGADAVRVHDVAASGQALRVALAVRAAREARP